jgi:hypothetical protein
LGTPLFSQLRRTATLKEMELVAGNLSDGRLPEQIPADRGPALPELRPRDFPKPQLLTECNAFFYSWLWEECARTPMIALKAPLTYWC